MGRATDVYFEVGRQRSFACAVDWPGWCRVAKSDDAALEALTQYAPRYAAVVRRAGHKLPATIDFSVVESVPGSGATDFGAPSAVPAIDSTPMSPAVARRTVDVLSAAWAYLDEVAAGAPPVLRKGPRGGGRDRDQILAHVVESEISYVRMLGIRGFGAAATDTAALGTMRAAVLDAVRTHADGTPARDNGWPARYAARRIAWHVLDHAWEIEDKS